MKKKIFITIFCIILVTSITAGVLYLFLRKKPAHKINEQTQVVEYIKSLNDSLLKKDIELLIEKNKLYWGGDLDF